MGLESHISLQSWSLYYRNTKNYWRETSDYGFEIIWVKSLGKQLLSADFWVLLLSNGSYPIRLTGNGIWRLRSLTEYCYFHEHVEIARLVVLWTVQCNEGKLLSPRPNNGWVALSPSDHWENWGSEELQLAQDPKDLVTKEEDNCSLLPSN